MIILLMLWYYYITMLKIKIIIEVYDLIRTIGVNWYNIGKIGYIYILNSNKYI